MKRHNPDTFKLDIYLFLLCFNEQAIWTDTIMRLLPNLEMKGFFSTWTMPEGETCTDCEIMSYILYFYFVTSVSMLSSVLTLIESSLNYFSFFFIKL